VSPQIDPALAVVWRSPHELQIGAPEPCVVVERPDRLRLDLVHLLRRGASVAALESVATALGGGTEDVADLLGLLAPSLTTADRPTCAPAASKPIVVVGSDGSATTLTGALGLLGYPVIRASAGEPLQLETPRRPRLVVLVEPRVIAPALHLPLLRRDLPHLPVVSGDRHIALGPLVIPGETACLRCLDLARRDADEAWPAIAAQLLTQPPPPPDPRLELMAISSAARAIDALLAHDRATLAGVVELIPRDGGRPRRVPVAFHPECGCRVPGGIATAPDRPGAHRLVAPSSTRAAVSRG
jgi:hypothetical protein